MLLILLALGLELSVDRFHDNILSAAKEDHIIKILDEIHERQYELQKTLNTLASQIQGNQVLGAHYVQSFKYGTKYTNIITEDDKERYISWKNFRYIIFIIGSCLLLFAKVGEYFLYNKTLERNSLP